MLRSRPCSWRYLPISKWPFLIASLRAISSFLHHLHIQGCVKYLPLDLCHSQSTIWQLQYDHLSKSGKSHFSLLVDIEINTFLNKKLNHFQMTFFGRADQWVSIVCIDISPLSRRNSTTCACPLCELLSKGSVKIKFDVWKSFHYVFHGIKISALDKMKKCEFNLKIWVFIVVVKGFSKSILFSLLYVIVIQRK